MMTWMPSPWPGGSYVYCPLRCGWRAKLTVRAGKRLRRFRRHWPLCPERPVNKPSREIPQLRSRAVTVFPAEPRFHTGLDGRVRKVQTVELPA